MKERSNQVTYPIVEHTKKSGVYVKVLLAVNWMIIHCYEVWTLQC